MFLTKILEGTSSLKWCLHRIYPSVEERPMSFPTLVSINRVFLNPNESVREFLMALIWDSDYWFKRICICFTTYLKFSLYLAIILWGIDSRETFYLTFLTYSKSDSNLITSWSIISTWVTWDKLSSLTHLTLDPFSIYTRDKSSNCTI